MMKKELFIWGEKRNDINIAVKSIRIIYLFERTLIKNESNRCYHIIKDLL